MKKEYQPRNVRVAAVHALASISLQLVRAKSEPSQAVEKAMELLRDLAAGDPTSSRDVAEHGQLNAYLGKKFGTLEPSEGPGAWGETLKKVYEEVRARRGGMCDEECVQEIRQRMADLGVKLEDRNG